MREEFEKLVAAGKLNRQHMDSLVKLTSCGYCMHRSWGFGRITAVDTVFGRFTIDFPGKRNHAMDLAFAAQSLSPIDKDHILARKSSDLPGLRHMAATHHLDLIKLVLKSYGGKATLEQIQHALVPDVIAEDWRKWWEAARQELKRDGHFIVPAKKTEPLIFQDKEVSQQDRLMGEFRAAKGLKARHIVAAEILKNVKDLSAPEKVAKEIIDTMNSEMTTYVRTQPAVALEAVFVRDDLRAALQLAGEPDEATTKSIWETEPRLGSMMEQIPAARHRRVLQSFRDANPDRWHQIILGTLNSVPNKLVAEFVSILIESKMFGLLKENLVRMISQHQASSELLLWLAKERTDDYADILGPEVFRAMLSAMERDQFNEKRSNRLRDYILDDQDLLLELIGSADLEVIKDLTRALQLSPCFDDMDKRSLLARIVKKFSAIQSLISGDQAKQDTTLMVSWESLERRKNEYADLVHKKIPANSKEIAIARSYGDLRENHEYKAAKEMQKFLTRRKSELEADLVRSRGSDFLNPRTEVVSIGTSVLLNDLNSQSNETYQILGAWDSDPEKNVVSYLSPLAQALLNKPVGEEIDFEMDGVKKRYRVISIEPSLKAPPETPQAAQAVS